MAKKAKKTKGKGENTDVVDAVEAAEAEANAIELAEKKSHIAEDMREAVDELRSKESASAMEVRLIWISIGNLMLEGRKLFIKENGNLDNNAFGNWMKAEEIDQSVGDRNQRTHAMWLAEVYNDNQDLYNLIPSQGTVVKRSPTTIQRWYLDQLKMLFQTAHDEGVEVGKVEDEAPEATVDRMTNLFEWANGASADMAEEDREGFDLAVSLARATPTDDLADKFIKFKPKVKAVKFADRDIDDAAEFLVKLLVTHDDAVAVYEAMKEELDAAILAMIDESDEEEDDFDDEDEDEFDDDDE